MSSFTGRTGTRLRYLSAFFASIGEIARGIEEEIDTLGAPFHRVGMEIPRCCGLDKAPFTLLAVQPVICEGVHSPVYVA